MNRPAASRVTHYHRSSWVELPGLLMMLTLVRPGELREACWSEVDTQAGQWIIPAERMKTRVRHIVPLSSPARLLFDLQRRMGFQGRQTPHGFRGFGQTNCIEQLKIPRVVTEKQLAHADGCSTVSAAGRLTL
jgi:integrase